MGEIDEAELLSAGQRRAVLDGMADGRKRIVPAAVLRRRAGSPRPIPRSGPGGWPSRS
jgi:hypothetical protein